MISMVRGLLKQKAVENIHAKENYNTQERGGRLSTVLSTSQAIPVVDFSYVKYISSQNLEAHPSTIQSKIKPSFFRHTTNVFINPSFHLYLVWLFHDSCITCVLL